MTTVLDRTNSYDRSDIVRREKVLVAGPMKIGAYRVRDPETDEFGELQFHMTYHNMVLAVLPASAVQLLFTFAGERLAIEPTDRVKELLEHNNTQLEENRAQRRTIAALKMVLAELTDNRSEDYLAAEDKQLLLDALEAAR